MPNFYLRHDVFGAKVAISNAEMAADLENGWEEFDPTVRDEEPVEPVRKGRRKLKDVPNFLAAVDDEGD
jgi:hypothetical protein